MATRNGEGPALTGAGKNKGLFPLEKAFVSQYEILVPELGEVHMDGLGGDPLERVVPEGAAGAGGGHDAPLEAHHLVLPQGGAALAVGAAGLDILFKQHGAFPPIWG